MHASKLIPWLLVLSAGCGASDPACQRQISACLARCDSTGADTKPFHEGDQERTLSWCEEQCQKCRAWPAASPASKPSAPPTPTN